MNRIALFAILITFSSQLFAQQNPTEQRLAEFLKRAPKADTNSDGKLTLDEWQAFNTKRNAELLKRFPQADTDGDGVLSREEIQTFAQARKKRSAESQPRQTKLPPTHAGVKYGDHKLQAFDIWLAKPKKAGETTPLCVFIHGGGFRSGDKSRIPAATIQKFLDQGISFASMNYRLTNGGEFPYPIPMTDSARGLQTIRQNANEWNIETEKIACFGGSAGAGISLWLAFRDDMADPESTDPVARQSTRILAAGTMNGQSTYDLRTFRKWFEVSNLINHDAMNALYNIQENETAVSPRVSKLAEDASPINHLSNDDPPVYMMYSRPNTQVTSETSASVWVHHPLLGLKLQQEMKQKNIECVVEMPEGETNPYKDIFDFLIQKLLTK